MRSLDVVDDAGRDIASASLHCPANKSAAAVVAVSFAMENTALEATSTHLVPQLRDGRVAGAASQAGDVHLHGAAVIDAYSDGVVIA